MLKILIVDDDSAKLKVVMDTINGAKIGVQLSIDDARDAGSAKRMMREAQYDLLILDVALPLMADKAPSPRGGLELLDEMTARPHVYRFPHHVIGLTAYDEVMIDVGDRFAADLIHLIKYDNTDSAWQEVLCRKLRHLALASQNPQAIPEHKSDLCIITALNSPELDAVLSLPWSWQNVPLPTDGTQYHKGVYECNGDQRSVVAASAGLMGMSAAGILATKMIETFRPRFLAMVGILAGIRGRAEMGDVVAADPSWDWGSGKLHHDNGDPGFAPSPHQIILNSLMRGRLAALSRKQEVFDKIRRDFQGRAPDSALRLRIGPVASGAAVLADEKATETVKMQHRKLIGIEMEAYGVLLAAAESSIPQPQALVLKSVCDFADQKKSDEYQHYAAYTSAQTLKYFAEEYLF